MELILGILGLFVALYFALLVSIGMDFSWIWLVGAGTFLGDRSRAQVYCSSFDRDRKRTENRSDHSFAIGLPGICGLQKGVSSAGCPQNQKEDLDYIIVLGAQVHGERPSRALKLRLEKAAQEWERCGKPTLLCPADRGDGESITEAECMKRFLVEKGIPEDKMILEDESVSTMENLQFLCTTVGLQRKEDRDRQQQFSCLSCPETCEKQGYQDVCGVAAGSGLAVSDPLHGAGSLCTGQRKD